MEYRSLGRTGMMVSPLCLGAMMFGEWGNDDHEDSVQIIHAALDGGINFIDTADVYSRGESEEVVGKALADGRRDEVILATKVHGKMGDDPNQQGNSRRWITMEVENSLRRLGTDWIDLYQIHRPDPHIDIAETLGALTDLQRAGKIRAFGSSTFPAEEIVEAQWCSERQGIGRFVTEQPPYSIFARGVEGSVLPTTERYEMGVLPWSPLAGGWLAGKYRREGGEKKPGSSIRAEMMGERFDTSNPENEAKLDAVEALVELAEEEEISLIHLALGFTLAHPAITAPIIGPRTMEHLESQLGAAEVTLTDDVLDRIDEIVPPGTDLDEDAGYTPPALEDSSLRRC